VPCGPGDAGRDARRRNVWVSLLLLFERQESPLDHDGPTTPAQLSPRSSRLVSAANLGRRRVAIGGQWSVIVWGLPFGGCPHTPVRGVTRGMTSSPDSSSSPTDSTGHQDSSRQCPSVRERADRSSHIGSPARRNGVGQRRLWQGHSSPSRRLLSEPGQCWRCMYRGPDDGRLCPHNSPTLGALYIHAGQW